MITAVKLTNYSLETLEVLEFPWALRDVPFWPEFDDERFPLLRWADEYGITYFSSYQMRGLIPELQLLRHIVSGETAEAAVDDLLVLAERCRAHPHQYLKMLGE